MTEPVITSKLLPIPHGFATRHGGVSSGPYASLNLGFSVGDEPGRVEENLRRLAGWAGVPPRAVITVSQVHGARVLPVEAPCVEPFRAVGEADALWTRTPDLLVGVKTADCVPVLLVDPRRQSVAAVHSGWRGTDARIVRRAVEALVADGSNAAQLLVAIGPSIQRCCYEVSEELAGRFRGSFGDAVVAPGSPGAPHLDLPAAVQQTLMAAGVRPTHIDLLRRCTSCEGGDFFSHRRDRGTTGRHLSFAVCRF